MAGRPELGLGRHGHISTKLVKTNQATGVETWRALSTWRHPVTGDYHQITASSNTEDKAEKALSNKLNERITNPTATGRGLINSSTTVAKLAAQYLVELEASNSAVGTKNRYRTTVENKIVPAIGNRKLHTLTQGTFTTLIMDQFAISPSEAKLVRTASVHLMRLALKHDAVKSNLAQGAVGRLPSVDRPDPRVLYPDGAVEVFELLASAIKRKRPGPHSRKGIEDLVDALSLQLSFGGRISEMLAIQAQDIDWSDPERPVITIHQAIVYQRGTGEKLGPRKFEIPGFYFVQPHTKAKDIRSIAVDEFAEVILRKRLEDPNFDGLLFYSKSTGAPLSMNNLRRSMRGVLGHSNYAWTSTHTMRRSLGTAVGNAPQHGVKTGMKVLGHKDMTTFIRRYMARDTETTDTRDVSEKFWQRDA